MDDGIIRVNVSIRYCVKIIPTNGISAEAKLYAINEARIIRSIRHPYVSVLVDYSILYNCR